MKRSTSPETIDALELAEYKRLRRQASGPKRSQTFEGVKHALTWYFEARERMQGPKGLHPRGEAGPGGTTVIVDVDGGQGGDMDDVLATISTIGSALRFLQAEWPRRHDVLVRTHRDGHSTRKIAEAVKLSHVAVSNDLGLAEMFVSGVLRQGGVLR